MKPDGNQTSDQNETLSKTAEYFENLFKDRHIPKTPNDPESTTPKKWVTLNP